MKMLKKDGLKDFARRPTYLFLGFCLCSDSPRLPLRMNIEIFKNIFKEYLLPEWENNKVRVQETDNYYQLDDCFAVTDEINSSLEIKFNNNSSKVMCVGEGGRRTIFFCLPSNRHVMPLVLHKWSSCTALHLLAHHVAQTSMLSSDSESSNGSASVSVMLRLSFKLRAA